MSATAPIVLLIRFDGDIAVRTVHADFSTTIGEVAETAATLSVGRFVPTPPQPAALLVRRTGDEVDAILASDLTVGAAGLRHLDCVDIAFAGGH